MKTTFVGEICRTSQKPTLCSSFHTQHPRPHILPPRFLALLFLLLGLPAAVHAEDFTYITNNGAITIQDYVGSSGEVTVPATINDLPVTALADIAFSDSYTVTYVSLPDCLTNIGSYAFFYCGSLTGIRLGTNLAQIGSFAFRFCTSLTNITIPASVSSIGGYAFASCPGLTAITVTTTNPAYCSLDGVLFDKNQTLLLAYPGAKPGSYAVPGSVTNIAAGAFLGCAGLTGAAIPNSVTSLGDYAFGSCASLANLTFGNSLATIGNYAFDSCPGLTNLILPDSLTSVGEYAFMYCANLAAVTLSTNLTSLSFAMFYGCASLAGVTLTPVSPASACTPSTTA